MRYLKQLLALTVLFLFVLCGCTAPASSDSVKEPDSLSKLREAMEAADAPFGVAYLGNLSEWNRKDSAYLETLLQKNGYDEQYPFIHEALEAGRFSDCGGWELFCLVPPENASIALSHIDEASGAVDAVLFRSETGEPCLFAADLGLYEHCRSPVMIIVTEEGKEPFTAGLSTLEGELLKEEKVYDFSLVKNDGPYRSSEEWMCLVFSDVSEEFRTCLDLGMTMQYDGKVMTEIGGADIPVYQMRLGTMHEESDYFVTERIFAADEEGVCYQLDPLSGEWHIIEPE